MAGSVDQKAVAQTLDGIGATIAVTLSYHAVPISTDKMRSDLNKMLARIDRKVHGRDYHKMPRTRGWAVIEGQPENPHWHCGLVLPVEALAAIVELQAARTWQVFAPSGTMDVRLIYVGENGETWAGYATKELHDLDAITLFP
jgi:hypothetical protein